MTLALAHCQSCVPQSRHKRPSRQVPLNHHVHTVRFENLPELLGELRVPIADDVLRPSQQLLEKRARVPGRLGHPDSIRIGRASSSIQTRSMPPGNSAFSLIVASRTASASRTALASAFLTTLIATQGLPFSLPA